MLAGLPVARACCLGSALGADPLRVLLHTGAGLGCLVVGGLLEGVGDVVGDADRAGSGGGDERGSCPQAGGGRGGVARPRVAAAAAGGGTA